MTTLELISSPQDQQVLFLSLNSGNKSEDISLSDVSSGISGAKAMYGCIELTEQPTSGEKESKIFRAAILRSKVFLEREGLCCGCLLFSEHQCDFGQVQPLLAIVQRF